MKKIGEATSYLKILKIQFYSLEPNFSSSLIARENLMRSKLILTNNSKNTREITILRRRKSKRMRKSELLKKENIMSVKCLDLEI